MNAYFCEYTICIPCCVCVLKHMHVEIPVRMCVRRVCVCKYWERKTRKNIWVNESELYFGKANISFVCDSMRVLQSKAWTELQVWTQFNQMVYFNSYDVIHCKIDSTMCICAAAWNQPAQCTTKTIKIKILTCLIVREFKQWQKKIVSIYCLFTISCSLFLILLVIFDVTAFFFISAYQFLVVGRHTLKCVRASFFCWFVSFVKK